MPEKGYTKRRHKWSEEEIIAKIQEWHGLYGETPSASDWNPSDCNRSARIALARSQRWLLRGQRFISGEFPWPRTVQVAFGSWNNAIRAAGFDPRRTAVENLVEIDRYVGMHDLRTMIVRAQQMKDHQKLIHVMHQIADTALGVAADLSKEEQ